MFGSSAISGEDLPIYCSDEVTSEMTVIDIDPDDLDVAASEGLATPVVGRRIMIFDQPRQTWDAGASLAAERAIAKGDSLLMGLWVRGHAIDSDGQPIDGQGAVVEVVFQQQSAPYTKSIQYLLETDGSDHWKHYWLRLRCGEDYDAGEAGLSLQFGYMPQRLDLANVELWNYGQTPLDELPTVRPTYVGREAGARWRVEAERRIERIRKCDVSLRVLNADGHPITNRPVSVRQTRHHFPFGSAVNLAAYTRDDDDGRKYRQTIAKYFNIATIENSLKWAMWDGADQADRDRALEMVRSLIDQDILVRGHVLIWPGFGNSPAWLSELEDKPAALRAAVATHIREMGYATDGLCQHWDVVNEAFDNTDFERVLGRDVLKDAFATARGVLPDAKLYYNDYAGLAQGGLPTGHKAHFLEMTEYFKTHTSIDGIGIQGHFGQFLTPPVRMLKELDRYDEFGLDMLITEYDVLVTDPRLQADFTRDFMTACFSHPGVDGIMTWGFWEGAHWRPTSALWANDWTPTAMGRVWLDLVHDHWMTRASMVSDDNGVVEFRGFKGRYEIGVGEDVKAVKFVSDGEYEVRLGR